MCTVSFLRTGEFCVSTQSIKEKTDNSMIDNYKNKASGQQARDVYSEKPRKRGKEEDIVTVSVRGRVCISSRSTTTPRVPSIE